MINIKNLEDYEVLTPSGWSDFSGIKRSMTSILFTIEFDDNTTIKCTENHKIKYPNGDFLEACHVLIGDELFGEKKVINIEYSEGEFEVFDLLNVDRGNEYWSSGVVSHNCAFISDMEEIWASAQMTLSTGGGAIVLSTPNGVGNKFHQIWQQAQEGVSSDGLEAFNPILLPWYLHPERDQSWRDQQDALLGKRLASQECDCDFLTSGHTVIEAELLQFYEEKCVDPIEKRGIGGDLWIWKYPDYNKSYVVVADPSRGDGEDYSGCVVMEVESVEIVAEYKGKIDTQAFGRTLVSLATEYNQALLVIDNRNIGWSTIQVAIDLGYRNLYYSYKNDPYLDENIHLRKNYDMKNKEDMVPGLTTTTRNRPVYISKLEMYFREKTPIIYSKRLINELRVFMWVDGKPQAQRGYNDDLVMSLAMAFYIRDTALRMRQLGIELIKNAIAKTHKTVFKSKPIGESYWEMNTGKAGNKESLRWLL